MNILKKLMELYRTLMQIGNDLDKIRQTLGRIEKRQLVARAPVKFLDHEYQVYSQWGEDGLIQHILSRVNVADRIFVEFGVEKYTESNTRFLLINDNWSGLVIDGSAENINHIKNDPIYWKYNLKAECSFIDSQNINNIIKRNGISGDIGLLSIDVDGNDYYIFESIDVISPRIIVCEYNSLWGDNLSVSVPYDPLFVRGNAHYSSLYFGASINALTNLAAKKGYSLVGSNSIGANIFFVRNDLLAEIEVVTPKEVYVQCKFRQSRGPSGELTFLNFAESLSLLADMDLMDVENGKLHKIRDLLVG